MTLVEFAAGAGIQTIVLATAIIGAISKGNNGLKIEMDGRLDQLLEVTKNLAHREGREAERKEESERKLNDLEPKKDVTGGVALRKHIDGITSAQRNY